MITGFVKFVIFSAIAEIPRFVKLQRDRSIHLIPSLIMCDTSSAVSSSMTL